MPHISLNPSTHKVLSTFESWGDARLIEALKATHAAQTAWRESPFANRTQILHNTATILNERCEQYATLISREMGKPIKEARAEVLKCAATCEYYAEHGERLLAPRFIETDAGKSYVAHFPLGAILAIMPWNFPFWQVFRAALPNLMAGNAVALKHAPNTPQCALAIENLLREAGLPEAVFSALFIEPAQAALAISSPYIAAVTLTGSEAAGRKVAALAGAHLKKCVLELGGSDPFIVLRDADMQLTLDNAVASRFLNCGQSCISAKRIIVVPEIADEFVRLLKSRIEALVVGNPLDEATQIGPMAREDLRANLHRQIADSVAGGAIPLTGCEIDPREGFYYRPSLLDHVPRDTPAWQEELFGPVAAVIRAKDEADALNIANDTRYGLGASLWSRETARAERLSGKIEAGQYFINGLVKSDPRLPFGGIKASGFGRELSSEGILEFVNAKTVWIR
jgi:succinate-semialdehyde dehydrogenase/glutarate-semialdehyde dehydrogenase